MDSSAPICAEVTGQPVALDPTMSSACRPRESSMKPGILTSTLPRSPTATSSCSKADPSANMDRSREARAPFSNSTMTKALSKISGVPSGYCSSRWLTSWAPEAITRTGRLGIATRIKSKKWQHFSTRVPPVFALKRFQWPTLSRNGNRCSRIESIRTRPVELFSGE